jgi:FkbM family methyltransferase
MASIAKLAALALRPGTWGSTARGVAATLEHEGALGRFAFRTVIDVGANKGQFAAFARGAWPEAALYCFEPLPEPRAKLAAVTGGRARIFDCALGAEAGEVEMHVASRMDSSSLLPLGERQKTIFQMGDAGRLKVAVRRLDAALAGETFEGPCLLKIDVQGFERQVLEGAGDVLTRIDAAYVELSFIELYEGQALASEIVAILSRAGLDLSGVFNQATRPDGEAVQADFLFLRRKPR